MQRELRRADQDQDWTVKAAAAEKDEQIASLEKRIAEVQEQLASKSSEVAMYSKWSEQNKALSQDEVLKDVIDEYKVKILAQHENEQKEISDAAYQTIKTLQDMIEQKNEQLKKKEENIVRLRDQMKQQAQLDANTINALRE